ncbi:hypothetical protein D046_0168B, partial [Vibrio parahaemolyticus V-223/04]
AA